MLVNSLIEKRSSDEREKQQTQQLQTIIKRVYEKTPFYADRMTSLGLTPDDFTKITDISKLPLLTADDLAANHPFGLLTIPLSGIARLQRISDGRTAVGFTQQDLSNQTEMIARTLVSSNIMMTSVILILTDEIEIPSLFALQQGAEMIGATVLQASTKDIKEIIRTVFDYGVTTLFGSPDSLLKISGFLKELGFSAQDLLLQNLLSFESLCNSQIKIGLQNLFQVPLFTLYGMPDILPVGIGGTCHAESDLHLHDDHFYAEIIDPCSEKLVSSRQAGELVLTTLTREAMPLIRYRTGTKAMLTQTPCSCGRTSQRLRLFFD